MNVAGKEKVHDMTPHAILDKFKTDFNKGLSKEEVAVRLAKWGENRLRAEAGKGICEMLFEQFTNIIVIILIFAGVASMIFQEYVEGAVILAIVVINAFMSVYQEYSAGSALAALTAASASMAQVLRDGKWQDINALYVVPGDVFKIGEGDKCPADGYIFTADDLAMDEAKLTGESVPVKKATTWRGNDASDEVDLKQLEAKHRKKQNSEEDAHMTNMCFSSTLASMGAGVAVAVGTGMNTRVGRIAELLSGKDAGEAKKVLKDEMQEQEQNEAEADAEKHETCWQAFIAGEGTPLQKALHKMGLFMGFGALTICVIVFIVGTLIDHKDPSHGDQPTWLQMIMVSVSLAVSGVPEGLPVCVTICLSIGMREMAKRGVVVRSLPAVETLGSISVICSDKTGTLTEGIMIAEALWCAASEYRITAGGKDFAYFLAGETATKYDISGDLIDTVTKEPGLTSGSAAKQAIAKSSVILLNLCCNAKLEEETAEAMAAEDAKVHADSDVQAATKAAIAREPRLLLSGYHSERPITVLGAKVGIYKKDLEPLYPLVSPSLTCLPSCSLLSAPLLGAEVAARGPESEPNHDTEPHTHGDT
jgi:magnesium-transporting ATPase (P-type)